MAAYGNGPLEETESHLASTVEQIKALGLMPPAFRSPMTVYWELTYRCPLQCLHCYNNSGPVKEFEAKELSDAVMEGIARQIGRMAVPSVILTGGEPLVRKETFFRLAKILHESGASLSTTTSGWLVTPAVAQEMARYFQSVQVSVDGARAETHDSFRQKAGSFARALEALRLFAEAGIPILSVNFSPSRFNQYEFEELVDLCLTLPGLHSIRMAPLVPSGRGLLNKERVVMNPQEQKAFIRRVHKKQAEIGSRLRLSFDEPSSSHLGRDGMPNVRMSISGDGRVGSSFLVPLYYGHAQERPLQELWDDYGARLWENPAVKALLDPVTDLTQLDSLTIRPWVDQPLSLKELMA